MNVLIMSCGTGGGHNSAAAAVFSHTVSFTPSDCKNPSHWRSACSCDTTSRISDNFAPGSASKLCRIAKRTDRTMWKSWAIIASYTCFTDPAVLFSIGSTPYSHSPFSIAVKTCSKSWTYIMPGLRNNFSHACCANAPSTPQHTTDGACGKSGCVSAMAARTWSSNALWRSSS